MIQSEKSDNTATIRLEFNGAMMAISNDADAAIITATLNALQQLH